ncbi:hypothetical protein ACNAUY_08105 [Acinetobacter tibetensis]|uniref:hypothetical protein n=1 Tax=Acinetobacter tibetensis TaxID=2943497 RepID=UPI003A4D7B19
MPLWMQLLMNAGHLSNPADGEGGDLGGSQAPTPAVEGGETPNPAQNPAGGGEESPVTAPPKVGGFID